MGIKISEAEVEIGGLDIICPSCRNPLSVPKMGMGDSTIIHCPNKTVLLWESTLFNQPCGNYRVGITPRGIEIKKEVKA